MTIAARNVLIALVIEREGGVADIGDGKGETRWGQTPGWLAQFDLPVPQTVEDAAKNYAAWLSITGLDAVIGDEPDHAADFLIDFAVHSDHRPAIKVLQRALGLVTDGVIGPKTRAAVERANRRWLAYAILAAENRYQGGLITDNPDKHARWARGWANRNADKLLRLFP
jgi:lysozyme family protein